MKTFIIVSIFVLIGFSSFSQINTKNDSDRINDQERIFHVNFYFNRTNTGCGVIKYANCYKAKIIGDIDSLIYGEFLQLYVICPEVLNNLPHKPSYTIRVSFQVSEAENCVMNDCQIDSGFTYKKVLLIDIW